MFAIVCVALSLILAVALVLCRTRLRRVRMRTGDPVDYGVIPGTQMFDAQFEPVPPSDQSRIVLVDIDVEPEPAAVET